MRSLFAVCALLLLGVASAQTPSPTAPPLHLNWNSSLAQFGSTNFNLRSTNKGRQVVVASWTWNGNNNVTCFTTRHGAYQWSVPMVTPGQQATQAYFAASDSHVAVMNDVLITLDTNGNTLWSTWLPFSNNITGLAVTEEAATGSTVVVVAATSCLAYVRNGVLTSSTPGSYGNVVVIRDGVVVAVRNGDEVVAYHLSTEEWMWSVKVPQGPFLTQASIGGGDVAIGTPGYVLLVDLQTGTVRENFTSVPSAVAVFDVAVSQDLLVISGMNEGFDGARSATMTTTTAKIRGQNAYPSILFAYNKTVTKAPIWQYNSGSTQTGVTIDDATAQVAFATSQSLVVLNLNTGAILGKMTKVQDYNQLDRPALAANGAVLFTGGLKESQDISLISVQVKP